MIEKQIDRNRVVQRDLHDFVRGDNLDVLALRGDFQILHHLENGIADLFFLVTVHDRKARLFLHLVAEFVVRHVSRHDLDGRVDRQKQDGRIDDGLELAFSLFAAAACSCAAIADASRVHEIHLPEPPVLQSFRDAERRSGSTLCSKASIPAVECRELGKIPVPGEERASRPAQRLRARWRPCRNKRNYRSRLVARAGYSAWWPEFLLCFWLRIRRCHTRMKRQSHSRPLSSGRRRSWP